MRSIAKVTSEPSLFGNKGNKPFAPVKRASITRATDSYKLSSKVKNMLSNDLKSSTYGGCGNDAGIQSMNPRRRFQRRGSKSPSMFKVFSNDHFDIPDTLFATIRNKPTNSRNNMFLETAAEIQKGSERSCSTSMEEDTSESTDADEFACSSYDR